jgi:hypothetical protein
MAQSTILGLTDSNFPTIDEIAIICGTDWFVGTPPDRMKIGMEALKWCILNILALDTHFYY